MRYFRIFFVYLAHIWHIFGTYLAHIWHIFGTYLAQYLNDYKVELINTYNVFCALND